MCLLFYGIFSQSLEQSMRLLLSLCSLAYILYRFFVSFRWLVSLSEVKVKRFSISCFQSYLFPQMAAWSNRITFSSTFPSPNIPSICPESCGERVVVSPNLGDLRVVLSTVELPNKIKIRVDKNPACQICRSFVSFVSCRQECTG